MNAPVSRFLSVSSARPRFARMRSSRIALRLAGSAAAGILLAAAGRGAAAQSFTRVLDPANRVVTDTGNSGGGCWVDLDDDGDLDLLVANGNLVSQANALYLNTGAGTFVKVTTGAVVTDGGSSIGGTFGDYDGDGRLDLFVTNRNNFGNFLYHGEGDTLFTKVTETPPVTDISNSNSSSWVDVDGDGDLDLYVVNFEATDFLYRNDGGTFVSVNAPPLAGTSSSIPGAWADYDADRDPDLFLGIAGSVDDVLWRNEGELDFTSIPFSDGRTTLGASWGDYDNDGDLDLVAPSFLNEATVLYRNEGAPDYTLTPDNASPVSNTFANAVGSGWGDYDNDGDLDLFMGANAQNNILFENQGPPSYDLVRVTTGTLVTGGGNSFGCVWGDYDGDGQLDLFVANQQNQINFLYHNDGNANHWLTVRCAGTASNPTAIGARVHVRATIGGSPRWQLQEVAAQSGYNSQNLDLHFGLGDATVVDSLWIEWPSGIDQVLVAVAPDRLLRVTESASSSTGDPADGTGLRLQWDGGRREVRYALPEDGEVMLALFDVGGRQVRSLVLGDRSRGVHRVGIGDPLPHGIFLGRLQFRSSSRVGEATVRIVSLR
ncbi:MAG: CRTAC1 family protein [Candidatus Eisenbacteria bacterium]|uniref:CRTAC1 family protein n=1 Tax=Eiseniibacteriota bacterium TaxID=2212470 RepID=A0A956RNY2_UNCEI|nr:CRTAC1 family protein [Candidatus Eisenbacteria bacterium]